MWHPGSGVAFPFPVTEQRHLHASACPPVKSHMHKMHIQHCRDFSVVCKCKLCILFKRQACNKARSCGTKQTQQWKCTAGNRCEFWRSSRVKNITDNKIWKTIPRGGGKLSGGEGGKTADGFSGGWCLWQAEYWVSSLALVSSLSHVNTFARASPGFASRCCSPPCNRRDGVRPSEQELASPPRCQNLSNFTTHGTCEHDTVARRWIILSRPSEMNVLAPHYLILLSHSLCS